MQNPIDKFLNDVPMYRLMLYVLGVYSMVGIVLSFLGVLPLSGPWLLATLATLLVVCYFTNRLFVRLFKAVQNIESSTITALILFLILFPAEKFSDLAMVAFAGFLAMASKFLLTLHNRHVFNPAAFGAVAIGLLGWGAGWWVGTPAMLPVVAIGGLLVVRKTRRYQALLFPFLLAALLSISRSTSIVDGLLSWPVVFFGTIMLTEPLTLPASKHVQILEAVLVGSLLTIPFHVGTLYSTPELALLIGNVFAAAFGGTKRLYRLRLEEKAELSPGIFEFAFSSDQRLRFAPGQYFEWTLPMTKPDSRGNRRTFTVASSPAEDRVRIGIRVPEKPSAFKSALASMGVGDQLFGSNLGGEFTLPNDPSAKLSFIAGGIGITPFRSMAQDLADRNEKRDVVLLYSARTDKDFVYSDVFDRAETVGVRTVRVAGKIPVDRVKAEIPDFLDRTFYLSGPGVMVDAYVKMLLGMGVRRTRIRTDYFPGY